MVIDHFVVTKNLAIEIFLLVIEIVVMENFVKIKTLAMKKNLAIEKGGNQNFGDKKIMATKSDGDQNPF